MRYRVGPTAGSVATFPSSSQSPSRGGDASAGREYREERGRSDAWRSVAGGLLRRYFRAASRLPTTRCRPASVRCYRSSAKRAASQRRIDCPQMRPLGRVPVFGAAPDGLSDPGGAEAIRMHIKTSGHACFGTDGAALSAPDSAHGGRGLAGGRNGGKRPIGPPDVAVRVGNVRSSA